MEFNLEKELIDKCKAGETDAFAPLIKTYRKQLFSYLLRMIENRTAAEDLFQETLIKVWKAIGQYRHEEKFSSWLFCIAHNVAMDGLRNKKVRSIILHPGDLPENPTADTPLSLLVEGEVLGLLEDAINSLPDKQKEIYVLRQYSEMTFREISDHTGQPLNTVLSHMHYALEKIKKVLRMRNAI